MRTTLVTSGTRGDVQPMVVLGRELARRGHDVVLGVPPNLVGLVRAAGLDATALGPDTQAFMESPEGQRWLAAGEVSTFMSALMEVSNRHLEQSVQELVDVCAGADVIVSGLLWEDLALPVADSTGAGLVVLHSAPFRRNGVLPAPLVTTRPLPSPVNRLTHVLFERVWWKGVKGQVALLRSRLGLPGARRTTVTELAARGAVEVQAYSPALVPGRLQQEYGPARPLVGFLSVDRDLREQLGDAGVDDDLERWLAAGDAPVYVGFGSMPVTDPTAALRLVAQVTSALGLRALVSAGWGRLGETEHEHVRTVGALDHDAVLPRCRAAVHHGGAGTTAAVALAGIPAVVCSVFADQPFWGARTERLGVGAHLRFADLDEARLTAALQECLRPETVARAVELGRTLRTETKAASQAADLVEAAAR